jgi:hypothetical protein
MLLLEIVLLSLPVVVPVLKKIVPPFVAMAVVAEPKIEQFVIVFDVASAISVIVAEPEVAPVVVLLIVNEFPPVFKPLKVTLSAPFKLINGEPAVIAPEIVLAAPPVGEIVIAEYTAEPEPEAFKAAVAVSVVFAVTPIVITP